MFQQSFEEDKLIPMTPKKLLEKCSDSKKKYWS